MKTYLYLFVMAATTYLIRVLPLTLIRKPIQNPFLRSFLFYVPYVTLAVMTFPAIMNATQSPIAGAAAMDARCRVPGYQKNPALFADLWAKSRAAAHTIY